MADTTSSANQTGPFPNRFMAGLILFLLIGATLFFLSGNPNGAIAAQALIGGSILLLVFADAKQIASGQQKLFSILGVPQ